MEQQFIAGIYNYCDRWCERCQFTKRCRNFDSLQRYQYERAELNNKNSWKELTSNLEIAIKLLHNMAEKLAPGIENLLSAWTDDDEQKELTRKKCVEEHKLIILCTEYRQLVKLFFKEEFKQEIAVQVDDCVTNMYVGLEAGKETVDMIEELGECKEIINWYLYFMDAKLQRALDGKWEKEFEKLDESDEGIPGDEAGSAKIAIIAINRSIDAWARLYELIPSTEDPTLKILKLLETLKHGAMAEFPQAMQFVRPGFDE